MSVTLLNVTIRVNYHVPIDPSSSCQCFKQLPATTLVKDSLKSNILGQIWTNLSSPVVDSPLMQKRALYWHVHSPDRPTNH